MKIEGGFYGPNAEELMGYTIRGLDDIYKYEDILFFVGKKGPKVKQ